MRRALNLTDQLGSGSKLHDLRIFMAVVQAGSMGRAARQLHVAQPNISNSVANLERALGVRLLDRGRQGVAATPYGRAVIDCGVAIFDDLRQGLSKIRFLADGRPVKCESERPRSWQRASYPR